MVDKDAVILINVKSCIKGWERVTYTVSNLGLIFRESLALLQTLGLIGF